MNKERFEKKFKVVKKDSGPFIIVRLRDSMFYVDNYCFVDNKYINLFWKDIEVGFCRLSSVKEVF